MKKKRKFVTISIELDAATKKKLNEIANLSAVTLSQVVSVILAVYILNAKEIKKVIGTKHVE